MHYKEICRDHKSILKQCRCIGTHHIHEVECPGDRCFRSTLWIVDGKVERKPHGAGWPNA